MSLEQAVLDRLEKRNAQIAQLQSTVHALERAAQSQREHAMTERGLLLEENKKLALQIESDEQVAHLNRDHAEYQIASLTAEVAKLRAEVPLESTREALKNAVAKLQQHKSDIAKLYELADEIGRGTDESIADVMKRQGARIAGLVAKLQEVTTDRDRVRNELGVILAEANKSGRCNGDPVVLLMQGQADRDALTHFERDNARLDALVSKLQGELEERRAAETIAKMGTGEVVTHPHIDWQGVATNLQNEIARLNAKVGPLEEFFGVIKQYRDQRSIGLNAVLIYDHVITAELALGQLTA